MNCHQCQHPLPVTARFCGKCGAAVVKPEASPAPVLETPAVQAPTATSPEPVIVHTPEPVLAKAEADPEPTPAAAETEAPAWVPPPEPVVNDAPVATEPATPEPSVPEPAAPGIERARDVALTPVIDTHALADLKQMIGVLQNSQALSLKLLGDKANVNDMRQLAMQLFEKQLQALQQHETQVRQQLVALLQHHVKGLPERSDWLTQDDLTDIRQQLQVLRQEETRTQQALVVMDETMRQIPQAMQQVLSSAVATGVAHALTQMSTQASDSRPVEAIMHSEADELPGAEKSNHFLAIFLIGLLAGLTLVLGTMTLMNFVSASSAKPAVTTKVKPSGH